MRWPELTCPIHMGALHDDSTGDRMSFYFLQRRVWRFGCPRDGDVVGHGGYELGIWGAGSRARSLCLGKSWWCGEVEIAVGCVFGVAASKRM